MIALDGIGRAIALFPDPTQLDRWSEVYFDQATRLWRDPRPLDLGVPHISGLAFASNGLGVVVGRDLADRVLASRYSRAGDRWEAVEVVGTSALSSSTSPVLALNRRAPNAVPVVVWRAGAAGLGFVTAWDRVATGDSDVRVMRRGLHNQPFEEYAVPIGANGQYRRARHVAVAIDGHHLVVASSEHDPIAAPPFRLHVRRYTP